MGGGPPGRPPERLPTLHPAAACSLRAFSTAAGERTTFGGLQDKDRIFTNIYGKHDPFIKVRAAAAGAAASRLWSGLPAFDAAAGSQCRGRVGGCDWAAGGQPAVASVQGGSQALQQAGEQLSMRQHGRSSSSS